MGSITSGSDVSVVIRAYNSEKFIREAIESLIYQDYTGKIRIIICYDDRTNDRTYEVINNAFSNNLKNRSIEVIRQIHPGPFRALQRCGFENSGGDFVFLLDYDDYYPKNYIRAVVERSVAKGATFAFVKAIKVDERGNELGILARIPKDPYDTKNIIKDNYITTSAIALHVECLDRIKSLLRNIDHPYYDWIFEDWLIALLATKH